jgi:hypothetical protein
MERFIQWSWSPMFAAFVLSDKAPIEPISWATPGETLIRILFKAFQMDLPFEIKNLKFVEERVFGPHKEKLAELKRKKWNRDLMKHFNVRTRGSKHTLLNLTHICCAYCGEQRGNQRCIRKMCRSCCQNQTVGKCNLQKHEEVNPPLPPVDAMPF